MRKISVEDREGEVHQLEAEVGLSLMEIIREAGLDIEAACGGCCACATCHVYLDDKSLEKITSKEEDEESMLDQAFDVKKNSRLACQIQFIEDYDGIHMKLAPE